jgi:hypothetical protein
MLACENFRRLWQNVRFAEICFALVGGYVRKAQRQDPGRESWGRSAFRTSTESGTGFELKLRRMDARLEPDAKAMRLQFV